MSRQIISTKEMFRFTVIRFLVSCASTVMFILFRHTGSVRGPAGSLGIMSSLTGSAVAGWFAFRAGNRKLIVVAIFSVLVLAFWAWTMYNIVHVTAAWP